MNQVIKTLFLQKYYQTVDKNSLLRSYQLESFKIYIFILTITMREGSYYQINNQSW